MRILLSIIAGSIIFVAAFIAMKIRPGTGMQEQPATEAPTSPPLLHDEPSKLRAEQLGKAELVRVDKSDRLLTLLRDGKVIASYKVSLGDVPEGPKRQEGDERTPEGNYVIDWRNPKSRYFLSLHISYPDASDRARALAEGVSPGGDIMIHGQPNGYDVAGGVLQRFDWTDGCIAVTNDEMQQIWDAVPDGTPIEIKP